MGSPAPAVGAAPHDNQTVTQSTQCPSTGQAPEVTLIFKGRGQIVHGRSSSFEYASVTVFPKKPSAKDYHRVEPLYAVLSHMFASLHPPFRKHVLMVTWHTHSNTQGCENLAPDFMGKNTRGEDVLVFLIIENALKSEADPF
jgi:hypothetical protein